MKKIWLFYLKDLDLIERYNKYSATPHDSVKEMILYAYTTKGKYAKGFKDTRNMEKFHTKTLELTEDEFAELDDFYWGGCKLDIEKITCGKRGREYLIHQLLMTSHEYWFCVDYRSENIQSMLEKIIQLDFSLFNKEIKKCLIDIGYAEDYKYLTLTSTNEKIFVEENIAPLNIAKSVRWKNELGFFLYFFKDILNYEGIAEVLG